MVCLLRGRFNRAQSFNDFPYAVVLLFLLSFDVIYAAFYVPQLRQNNTVFLALVAVVALAVSLIGLIPKDNGANRPACTYCG